MSASVSPQLPVDPVAIAKACMARLGLTLYAEQIDMIRPMFESLQKKGTIFVGQGPPGMGKTYVIAAVTQGLRLLGKTVCIASPSYTHLREVMGRQLSDFQIQYAVLRGLSALDASRGEGCPLLQGVVPTPIFCSDLKEARTGPESEKCSTIDCTVRREIKASKDSGIVLTVFHKLIYKPSLIERFDTVIFDESHGLEAALRNARIVKIKKTDLVTLAGVVPDLTSIFDDVTSAVDRLSTRGREDIPQSFVEREILEPMREAIPRLRESMRESEETGGGLDQGKVDAFYVLDRAVNTLERIEQFRFVYHDQAVLGFPSRINFYPFPWKTAPRNASIALISATIESPRFHVNDAGFGDLIMQAPVQVPSSRHLEQRYMHRPILGLIDGPILRKDPGDRETYEQARNEANNLLEGITGSLNYPTLILCRSREDARSIKAHLEGIQNIKDRLLLFEDEVTPTELDAIETQVNAQIAAGKNMIVTTAASRLWEGVNLRSLRFLVIDALPYATPQPFDRFDSSSARGSWRTSRTFRHMIRRFQQGVGRLIRSDSDPWGIVVVIDGRFNAQWRTIKSVLPSYLTDSRIVRFVTRQSLRGELENTIQTLELEATSRGLESKERGQASLGSTLT